MMPSITTFTNPNFHTLSAKRPSYPPSPSPQFHKLYNNINNNNPLTLCSCSSNDNPSWDSAVRNALKSAIRRFDSFVNSRKKEEPKNDDDGVEIDEDWDWERWKKHFDEVLKQERIVNILKLQLGDAVCDEDYREAARLKVALAAAAANDPVGRAISSLKRAIEEERYEDAAFIRDNAGTGLVGWWAGISEDSADPYGQIIRITAEHGRYLARSFSPRRLTKDASAHGAPLFEIYFTVNKKGEYKQQAVYLKRVAPNDPLEVSRKGPSKTSDLNRLGSTEDKSDLLTATSENSDSANVGDESDDLDNGLTGFQNTLSDMIPGVRVRVLKVTAPGQVDKDLISKVIEQIVEEENEVSDIELEGVEIEDVNIEDVNMVESNQDKDEIEVDASDGLFGIDKPKEITVEVVIDTLPQKPSSSFPSSNLHRVPAKLEKNGQKSFSFSIKQDIKSEGTDSKDRTYVDKRANRRRQRAVEGLIFDLAKSAGREKIPLKVLKEVSDLISITMSQAQKQEQLSECTTFRRIEIPSSPDPLNGLYIGAHGLYTSEVIQLRRRYGQWQEDGMTKGSSNLEFYEYVEALKITGDPYVPAGEVAFRAKVGKQYQLPHKGLIPEEFGVIARYRGQGRLAEPGFQKPRWVDGELVILDGTFIKGGPVVGFVYWAPEYHFMVFFNRLRLQE